MSERQTVIIRVNPINARIMLSSRIGIAARWLSPAGVLRDARLRLLCSSYDAKLNHKNLSQFRTHSVSSTTAEGAAAVPAKAVAQPAKKQRALASVQSGDAVLKQAQHVQPVDYSTLVACAAELQHAWVPSKVEQVMGLHVATWRMVLIMHGMLFVCCCPSRCSL